MSVTPEQKIPSLPAGIENILARERRVTDIAVDLHGRAETLLEKYGAPEGWLRKKDANNGEITLNYLKTPPIDVVAADGSFYQLWLTQQDWDENGVTAGPISVKLRKADDRTGSWENEDTVRAIYRLPGVAIRDGNGKRIDDVEGAGEAETVMAEIEKIMAEQLEETDKRIFAPYYPQFVSFHPA